MITSTWTSEISPGAPGMELKGGLSWDKEQEVSLHVSHGLLHHALLRSLAPVRGINVVGRLHSSAPLLFSQASQQTFNLLPKSTREKKNVTVIYKELQNCIFTIILKYYL